MLNGMERRDDMRAADSDREAVAEQLRTALNEGRLDLGEYDERLQRAYAAKTYADLGSLLTDLPNTISPGQAQVVPVAPPSAPQPPTEPDPEGTQHRPAGGRSWVRHMWAGYVGMAVMLVAVWAMSAASTGRFYFWPIWALGPWGVLLLMRTAGGWPGSRSRRDRGRSARGGRRNRGTRVDGMERPTR